MIDVEKARRDTPGCANKIHFNNAGASLMTLPVINAIRGHLELEASIGGYEAADRRAADIQGFYESAAALLGAKPENIAFTSSATNSFARALSCVPLAKGDKVLIATEDYISNQLALLSMQHRLGIDLIRVASLPEGGVDLRDFERLMDLHKPQLVSLTHIPTNSGLIQPVAEVGKLCKARNIPYLIDACQSAGQLPLNVGELNCDFLSATFRKFLRGPRGTGFLFVSDKILARNWEPSFIDMRGADWTAANTYHLRPDARRFEEWELPYALVLGAKAAVEYALGIGLGEIRQHNAHLCSLVRKGIEGMKKLELLDQGRELGSIITIKVSGQQPGELLAALRDRNVNTSISYRDYAVIDFGRKGVEWALRVSPHYFNTEQEVDLLLSIIDALT